jgi:mercuric ion transport protein
MRGLVDTQRATAQQPAAQERSRQALVAAGGIFGALGASACCIAPLVLFSLGIGGAWIGTLVALEPYQPVFVAIALGFLGYGYWLVYRHRKAAYADGEVCARTVPSFFLRTSMYTATVLVAAAVAFPYVAPYFLGV